MYQKFLRFVECRCFKNVHNVVKYRLQGKTSLGKTGTILASKDLPASRNHPPPPAPGRLERDHTMNSLGLFTGGDIDLFICLVHTFI